MSWGSPVALLTLKSVVSYLPLLSFFGCILLFARRRHVNKANRTTIKSPFSLLMAFLLLAFPIIANLLQGIYTLPPIVDRVDLLAVVGTLFIVGFFFINHAPIATTVMIKLIGIGLLSVVMVLASILLFLGPTIEEAYILPHVMTGKQAFRFVPNLEGAYTLVGQPYHFSRELTRPLALGEQENVPLELDFSFPFYGKPQNKLWLADDGFITFEGAPSFRAFSGHSQPTIAPMRMNLAPDSGGAIFVKATAEKITITWQEVKEAITGQPNTFQLVLHRDGTIDFIYADIMPNQTYRDGIPQSLWLSRHACMAQHLARQRHAIKRTSRLCAEHQPHRATAPSRRRELRARFSALYAPKAAPDCRHLACRHLRDCFWRTYLFPYRAYQPPFDPPFRGGACR